MAVRSPVAQSCSIDRCSGFPGAVHTSGASTFGTGLLWRRRADDAARICDCDHSGAGDGAGRAFLVDWDSYRNDFEARASALTGLEFKVAGRHRCPSAADADRDLHDIQFGRPGEPAGCAPERFASNSALGSLLRGEWKVADARLEGPELAVGLDRSGHLALPVPSVRLCTRRPYRSSGSASKTVAPS